MLKTDTWVLFCRSCSRRWAALPKFLLDRKEVRLHVQFVLCAPFGKPGALSACHYFSLLNEGSLCKIEDVCDRNVALCVDSCFGLTSIFAVGWCWLIVQFAGTTILRCLAERCLNLTLIRICRLKFSIASLSSANSCMPYMALVQSQIEAVLNTSCSTFNSKVSI